MDKTTDKIYEKIGEARTNRFLTNCYSMDVVEKARELWCEGNSFIFSYEDNSVNRLVYFAESRSSIDRLLKLIGQGLYYLEFMTNNPNEYIPGGLELRARMMRLANPDCRLVFDSDSRVFHYMNTTEVELALESDAKEINSILWSTFSPEVSHLLSDNEIREKIINQQITIHKDKKTRKIDALLQADMMPKKFYINQVVNRAEKNVIHAILLQRLEQYVHSGGKYLYAWVEDKNIASVRFHEKYGMKHDGMWSMIYMLEK